MGFVRIPQRSKRSDRVGLEGKELDLYNDKLKIAIEYDGEYSHTKNKDDEGKNKIVEKLGIKLIVLENRDVLVLVEETIF